MSAVEVSEDWSTISGRVFSDPVRVRNANGVTLRDCRFGEGSWLEVLGSHNFQMQACRFYSAGTRDAPAIRIGEGTQYYPISNDVTLRDCQIEHSYGIAVVVECSQRLKILGTKLHGWFGPWETPSEEYDRELLVLMRTRNAYVDRACLFTGGHDVLQRPLVVANTQAFERAGDFDPQWGARTSGARRHIRFVDGKEW